MRRAERLSRYANRTGLWQVTRQVTQFIAAGPPCAPPARSGGHRQCERPPGADSRPRPRTASLFVRRPGRLWWPGALVDYTRRGAALSPLRRGPHSHVASAAPARRVGPHRRRGQTAGRRGAVHRKGPVTRRLFAAARTALRSLSVMAPHAWTRAARRGSARTGGTDLRAPLPPGGAIPWVSADVLIPLGYQTRPQDRTIRAVLRFHLGFRKSDSARRCLGRRR